MKKIFYFFVALIIFSSFVSAQSVGDAINRMKQRRPQIDALLISAAVGEQLDGLLKINTSDASERQLATDENQDRQTVFAEAASATGSTPGQVGRDFALKNIDRYVPGVNREIDCPPKKWWDGHGTLASACSNSSAVKVLAQNGAKIYQDSNKSMATKSNLPYFEAYYVVSELNQGGLKWFKVTPDIIPNPKPANWAPKIIGWMCEDEVIPWNQSLVMVFTESYGRSPSLFFDSESEIQRLAQLPDSSRQNDLRNLASNLAPPVIGKEIFSNQVSAQKKIYPVLNYSDLQVGNQYGKSLEVAAVSETSGIGGGGANIPVDIVFVIDTTGSMSPYIDALKRVTTEFTNNLMRYDIRLGVVGYRDNVDYLKNIPSLEYTSRHFNPSLVVANQFGSVLSRVTAVSKTTSDDVAEEVYAGIQEANNGTQWRSNAAKFIFLIGDAPAHEPSHKQSSTGATANTIRNNSFRRGVNIFAMHLSKSKHSRSLDSKTKSQFTELSRENDTGAIRGQGAPRYYEVDSSNIPAFEENIKTRFQSIEGALSGKLDENGPLSPEAKAIFAKAELERPPGATSSQHIESWVSDLDLSQPSRKAALPCVLLTKSELDQLDSRLKDLEENGIAYQSNPTGQDFFTILQQNSLWTIKNPAAVDLKNAFGLTPNIDNLPYKSEIMNVTRDDFDQWSSQQFADWISKIQQMRNHYRDLRVNQDVWKKLSSDSQDRDRVTWVSLYMLP